MSGTRIALEQFASTALTATLERPPATPPDRPVRDLPAHAVTAPDNVPPMGDPLIRRPPAPEEDPHAEEIEALKSELSQACTRLGDIVTAVEAERATAVDRALREMADRVADVGTRIIGSVVDRGLALEIAAAVVDLASRIPHDTAELHVAAQEHEAMAEALARHAPETAITLVPDASLAAGRARMLWPDGGADLDGDRLAARIGPLISQRISDLMPRRQ